MRKLVVTAIATVALTLALGLYLIRANTLTANQLCQAIGRIVVATPPAPGTADYRYYKAHPEKLAQARKRFLDQLPCKVPARPIVGVRSHP